jgi:hypothetical protein
VNVVPGLRLFSAERTAAVRALEHKGVYHL